MTNAPAPTPDPAAGIRTVGTLPVTSFRQGHDLVVVAELLGHARLDQTRRYSLPTHADRLRAISSLLTDN